MTAVELRPFTDPDLEVMAAISTAWNKHFHVPIVDTAELFDEELSEPLVLRSTDVRVATIDNQSVGYVYTYHLASDTHDQRCYVFARVLPEFLSRGVGSELTAWGAKRAEQKLREGPDVGKKYLRADAPMFDVDAHRIFTDVGMVPVRWFAEMRAAVGDVPKPVQVDGITIVDWDAVDDNELHRVKNEAFADHWGSVPDDDFRWSQLTTGVSARRNLSCAAVDARGDVVGLVLTHRFPDDDVEVDGRVERVGWVDKVATLQSWRGRGVASALISNVVERYQQDALTHAGLYVDSDNPTGAVSVYEKLGFRTTRRSVTYEVVIS